MVREDKAEQDRAGPAAGSTRRGDNGALRREGGVMAAAAMAHAYPLVRGCGGEASPGPAARSQAWKLRAARRGLSARSGRETGAGDVASLGPAGGGAAPRGPQRIPGTAGRSPAWGARG